MQVKVLAVNQLLPLRFLYRSKTISQQFVFELSHETINLKNQLSQVVSAAARHNKHVYLWLLMAIPVCACWVVYTIDKILLD